MTVVTGGLSTCQAFREHPEAWIHSDDFAAAIGQDLKSQLAAYPFAKGEYETTDEQNKRIQNALEVFFGHPESAPFMLTVGDDQQHYDADAGVLTVSVPSATPRAGYHSYSEHNLPLFANEKKVGRYLGTTRMGIKFHYEVWVRYERFLGVPSGDFDRAFGNSGAYTFTQPSYKVEMDREHALAVRNNLAFAVLARIAPPYASTEKNDENASLDDPTELATQTDIISATPRCVYLVDTVHKQVLKSIYEEP